MFDGLMNRRYHFQSKKYFDHCAHFKSDPIEKCIIRQIHVKFQSANQKKKTETKIGQTVSKQLTAEQKLILIGTTGDN